MPFIHTTGKKHLVKKKHIMFVSKTTVHTRVNIFIVCHGVICTDIYPNMYISRIHIEQKGKAFSPLLGPRAQI